MARLSPTIQGPCCSCVCRVIPVPCLGSGFLRCHCRRALSCSIAACSGFFWAMVQTLPWLLISVSLGQPQPDPSVSTCCTASHVVLCRSRCLVFLLPPSHGLPPCSTAESKRRRQKKTKATRKNRERKKNGPGRSRASKFCVSTRMAKEGNATPIGQQVLLLQCVSDVVSMPWWPD